MAFSIRKASPDDADYIAALSTRPHVRGQLHPLDADAYLRSLERRNAESYVLERDEARFGYLAMQLEDGWLLNVRALAVWTPKLGGGRHALEFAIGRGFEELGAKRIYLEVVSNNAIARRLFERLGFRMEGVFRDGYRDESGTFLNLVAYGLLAAERRTALR